MRTHECAANLALAGWSLAPLLISVNPTLNVTLTACLVVYVSCYRSVKATPPPKIMSKKCAMLFPLVQSVMLLSLFLLFKFVSKDLINDVNVVLTEGFFILGIVDLYATLLPLVGCFLPQGWTDNPLILHAPHDQLLSVEFTKSQVVASITAFFICVWYAMKKHWLANNVLAIAFCIQQIEMVSLGSFKTGGIFLAGLFVYDIFWVFFTPVMDNVTQSLDAPTKLLFPTADAFFMLGLGDIMIPGRFVALALRFDVSRGIKNRYFYSAFLGYTAGITAAIATMNWFQAGQPALFYIIPSVTGFVAAHSLWNGEVKPLLEFAESQAEEEKADEGEDLEDPKQSKKVD